MCRCLRLHPSGFYAWVKNPLSRRAQEDDRQIKLLKEAWEESGNIYGYRKLHDDLCDLGETCCPNRVARLARLAGIHAQIGYKRRPGKYGGNGINCAGSATNSGLFSSSIAHTFGASRKK